MTSSRKIVTGLALGILTGLFFGERAGVLKWVADGFVKLLQMMVLPYITVSIITTLGSLKSSELRALGLRAAAVIGGLWLLALAFAFLVTLSFPPMENASPSPPNTKTCKSGREREIPLANGNARPWMKCAPCACTK